MAALEADCNLIHLRVSHVTLATRELLQGVLTRDTVQLLEAELRPLSVAEHAF